MKKRRQLWVIAAAVVGLGVLCLGLGLGGAYVYSSLMRSRAFNSRPLVLIHNPQNREAVGVGERLLVHATGRAKDGLQRLELWANDELVATKEAPDFRPSTMVLSQDWVPTLEGTHTLVVRAVAANGTQGQSTVAVTASQRSSAETGQEVSAEAGVGGEEPSAAEGEEGGEAASGGAESPDGGDAAASDEGGAGAEPPESEEEAGAEPPGSEEGAGAEPPEAEGESPGGGSVFDGLFGWPFPLWPLDEVPRSFRVEVPSLRTDQPYDRLHCYVELAGTDPRWYPDEDSDPSTDESFASLGAGWWDSAAHLGGATAPVISWPPSQPIPLAVTCVGVVGGTEAMELGRVELNIPYEDWDGMLRHAAATGAEGSYEFWYRVSLVWLGPVESADMTAPTNARLDDRPSLNWDYVPAEDEPPIDGFRIYLNENLQWTEAPDARASGLPSEWVNPPCGATYTFGVTAYRAGFPDGPESEPATVDKEQALEDCQREIQIVFETLQTFDLGGDGQYEDRTGDVGPAYGYFYANRRVIPFSGGLLGPGLDRPQGLSHYTRYDLGAMSADPAWHFTGMNYAVVPIRPGGTFEFGFHIMDQDSGRCDRSGDPGCDDLICEGSEVLYEDGFGAFDRRVTEPLTSDNGRCRLNFSWGPAAGSPVGTGVPGWEPLPWIHVERMEVDEATGQVRIHLRNTGTAAWPWRDLKVELQTRDGTSVGTYTWPEFVLEAGQETVLENPDMVLSAPYDACVLIDPLDEVPEEGERSGALIHTPFCPRLPDLTITRVMYDPAGGGRVRVTVMNIGGAAVENRTLNFSSSYADGTPTYLPGFRPGVSLRPGRTRTFDLSGVTDEIRSRLADGYSVTVNPEGTLAEVDLDNNTYVVRGNSRMTLHWCNTAVPHYGGWGHTVRMDMELNALSGSTARGLISRRLEEYFSVHDSETQDTHYLIGGATPGRQCTTIGEFEILGDERLQVRISGHYLRGSRGSWDSLGSGTATHSPQDNWGADVAPTCSSPGYRLLSSHAGWHDFRVRPNMWWLRRRTPWTATYHLCLESPGGE
ncbi:MAG TPA: hypothetical protein VLL49_06595 [Anaerolineales bacterium]|nr:hypothetical protein [Anaerolineales bacterium]